MIPICRAETIKQDFTQETDSLKCIDGVWYAVGFYEPQKEWKTRCLKCDGFNTDSRHEDYTEISKCLDCNIKSYFHDDNWEHGYIGDVEHLIRNNGEKTIVDQSTLAISQNRIDWFSIDEFNSILNTSQKTKERIAKENGHEYSETYFR